MFTLRQCISNSMPSITAKTIREEFMPCKTGCRILSTLGVRL